jgi:hypothetical protein
VAVAKMPQKRALLTFALRMVQGFGITEPQAAVGL